MSFWNYFKKFKFEELPPQQEKRLKDISYNRILVVTILFVFAFSIMSYRLIDIMVISKEEVVANINSVEKHPFYRREITDRNGILIAVNLSTPSLYAHPALMSNKAEVANKLAKIFPSLNEKTLLKSFESGKPFVWIKRNLTPNQQYEVNNLGIHALGFEDDQKRIYPYGNLLSHVLGFVGNDAVGLAGIEKYYDEELTRSDLINQKFELSIDIRAQTIIHEELTEAIKEFNAEGGVGIITNVNNGEILAIASMPDFDPNNPGSATSLQLFNRSTLGVYEQGSIFKICSMAMALDAKAVSLNDVYYVKDPIKASRFNISDYYNKGSYLTVPQIFMFSSNIGTARMSLDLGRKKQQQFLKKFGLFETVDIDLPEKGYPIYPSLSNWTDINTMTISFGHGIAVTPLHINNIASAIVNGGYLYNSRLAKLKDDQLVKAKKVLSEETSEKMRRLLRLVVTHGTGSKANAAGYLVGGKSGTAEKSVRGGYSKNQKLSSFVAAFPIHEPKYSVLVILDNPISKEKGLSATGGRAAAPVVNKIITRIAPILGVRPYDENDPEVRKKLSIEFSLDQDLGDEDDRL